MRSLIIPTPSQSVLIADDDAHVRQMCRSLLESEGYFVREAADARQLLSTATDHQPDIIITDAALPGLDGPGMIPQLQSASGTQDAAVIVLIELNDATRVMTSLDGSVDDYLAKPLRPAELAARVAAAAHHHARMAKARLSRDRLGENTRVLVSLLDFSNVLAESEQLKHLVQETAVVTASLLSCRRVAILLPNADYTSLSIVGAVGIDKQTIDNLVVPIGEGVAGRVYQSCSKILVDSPSEADPEDEVYDSRLYNHPPALAWPMRAPEQTVGVIHLADRAGQSTFTECELDYLRLLSSCAASAIQSILTRRSREEARDAITVALASLAEHRDNETGQHLERMTGFCLILAKRLQANSKYSNMIDAAFIADLQRAAPLHDIGKVAIPDHILLKPGRLTPDEMEIMKTHATIGAETIRSARVRAPNSRFLAMAEDIAHGHHEWVDGSGYPRGTYGTRIPLSAHIAALADVYDALTSQRVYKEAMSHAQAKSIIVELSDRQFDPLVIEKFLESEDEMQALAAELRDQPNIQDNASQAADKPNPANSAALCARSSPNVPPQE